MELLVYRVTRTSMSQRRMFSPDIVTSDAFLEMPPSTQALYFQLGMRADDDGFVNPKMVMRVIGSTEDELRVLTGKRFILPFENGVVVIKHWKVNNLIRKDWYRPTLYLEERSKLFVKDNGVYTLDETKGKRFVNEMLTVRTHRIGKDSIGNINTSAPVGASLPKVPKKKRTKKLDDNDPYTLLEFVTKMKESPQAHIRWIAEYADEKKPNFTTKGQWREFLNRNLAPAVKIRKYTDEQIEKAFEMIQWDLKSNKKNPKGYITKWGIETILKYLDEVQ
jgi:hypothetical protein